MKKFCVFGLSLILSCSVCAMEVSASADRGYVALKEVLLKESVLPIVESVLTDSSKVPVVMKKVEEFFDVSGGMDEFKEKTWACLSEFPERRWKFVESCFGEQEDELLTVAVLLCSLENLGKDIEALKAEDLLSETPPFELTKEDEEKFGKAFGVLIGKMLSLGIDVGYNNSMAKSVKSEIEKCLSSYTEDCQFGAGKYISKNADGTMTIDVSNFSKSTTIGNDEKIKGLVIALLEKDLHLTCGEYQCLWKP